MEDKKFILQKLERARNLTLRQLYFVVPYDSIPQNVEYLPTSRLVVIISGSKQATLPLKNGLNKLQLKAGDMLYCLPCTWEKHDWSGCYEMLCIVPRQDYLRISLYKQDSNRDIRPNATFYHTGHPYHEILRNMFRTLDSAMEVQDMMLMQNLTHSLIGLAEYECQRNVQGSMSKPELLFNRIRNWINNSFQDDIDRQLAAKVFKISTGYLSQLFKEYNNSTFHEYLTQCRMAYARELLEKTDFPIYQVADHVGFQNYVHFVRRFREINGTSPGKYRDTASFY